MLEWFEESSPPLPLPPHVKCWWIIKHSNFHFHFLLPYWLSRWHIFNIKPSLVGISSLTPFLFQISSVGETTPRSASSQSRSPSEPTAHAETQTQIRGLTLQSALWQNSRTASTDSAVSDISVATISRLLEQMEGGGEGGGLVTVPAVIFFTESDTNNRNKRLVVVEWTPTTSYNLSIFQVRLHQSEVRPGRARPHLRPAGPEQQRDELRARDGLVFHSLQYDHFPPPPPLCNYKVQHQRFKSHLHQFTFWGKWNEICFVDNIARS